MNKLEVEDFSCLYKEEADIWRFIIIRGIKFTKSVDLEIKHLHNGEILLDI